MTFNPQGMLQTISGTVGFPTLPGIGLMGRLGAMSSNGSNFGYRGTHQIGTSDFDLIYQVSTAFSLSAAPGLQNTWTKSSNTVQGAIGLGDTFVGFQQHSLGKLKFGEMYLPYKTSTDRLNPFGGGLTFSALSAGFLLANGDLLWRRLRAAHTGHGDPIGATTGPDYHRNADGDGYPDAHPVTD